MRVYLSGGMEYAEGEGVRWRKEMQGWIEQNLGHEVFNPNLESERLFATTYRGVDFRKLKFDDIEQYRRIAQHLVAIDCDEIARKTDYLICYWDEGAAKGAGTKGELTMAKFFGKPVYLVTEFSSQDLPGWVLGCVTKMFPDFSSVKKFLVRSFQQG